MAPKRVGLEPAEAAAKFGSQLSSSVSRFQIFNWVILSFTRITSAIGLSAAVVLLLFILHQLFLWVDKDPEKAFERAALILEVAETVWDTLGVLVNSGIDVSNAALIPMWNAYTFYVIEPIIILVMEVFSIVFFSHHYEGVIDEANFPYKGLECTSSVQAMTWCGRYQAYEQALINDESGFVNDSQIFLGLGTARRLSELSGVDEFATPSFDIDGVVDALTEVGTLSIVAAAPLADLAAAILDDVLVSSASVIFDAVFMLLKSLLETCKLPLHLHPCGLRLSPRRPVCSQDACQERLVDLRHQCGRGLSGHLLSLLRAPSLLRRARLHHVHGRLLLPVGVGGTTSMQRACVFQRPVGDDRPTDLHKRSGGAQSVWHHPRGHTQLGYRAQVHAFRTGRV